MTSSSDVSLAGVNMSNNSLGIVKPKAGCGTYDGEREEVRQSRRVAVDVRIEKWRDGVTPREESGCHWITQKQSNWGSTRVKDAHVKQS